MMVSAPSILAALMPAGDGAAPAGTTPDSAQAFAAMMAGLGLPTLNTADATNDDAVKDKDGADPFATPGDGEGKADKDERAEDGGEDADSLLAMTGATLALPGPPPVIPNRGKDAAPSAVARDATVAMPAPARAGGTTRTPTGGVPDGATPPVANANNVFPVPAETSAAVPPSAKADEAVQQHIATPTGTTTVTVAGVVGQVAQGSGTGANTAKPPQRPAIAALPVTSTADMLAARTGTRVAGDRTKAAKSTDAVALVPTEADASDDATPSIDAPALPTPQPASASATPLPVDISIAAGPSLAATGADRQLDLARGGAWLDGLARDIASSADSGGTLRFQLSPQRLGKLDVEVTRGDDGAAVKLTTDSAAAQAILSDAKPQLLAEARLHGVHITDARIDLAAATSAAGASADGHRPSSSEDRSGAGNPYRDGAASSGAGGGGDAGRHAQAEQQAQQQAHPQNLYRSAPIMRPSVRDSSIESPLAPTDERYA
jgi:hypothetical protein